MTKEDREFAIKQLKKICEEIGCNGVDPDLCKNKPHRCDIIKKLLKE